MNKMLPQYICVYCLVIILPLLTKPVISYKGFTIMPHNTTVLLKKGDMLRLVCPVVKSAAAEIMMYSWQNQNGEDLAIMHNYRMMNDSQILMSTGPVTGSDSGEYSCTAVTGFEYKKITFRVTVIDRSIRHLCAPNTSQDPSLEAPCFMDPTMKTGSRRVTGVKGQPLELSCLASGSGPLTYHWFFGTNSANWIDTRDGVKNPTLKIVRLRPNYNGHLRCQVSNKAGKLNYTFRLTVTEPISKNPKILTGLMNKTFQGGDTGTIKIMIKCSCKSPMVKWLKQVHRNPELRGGRERNAIELPNAREGEKNELFVNLEKKIEIRKLEKNLFESTLFLNDISSKDAGKYIVTAINSALGFKEIDYKVMYIDVDSDQTITRIKNNLVIYISVPIVILLSTVLMVIFCCLRRHANSSQGYSRSNNATNNNNNGCQGNGFNGSATTTDTNGYRSSGRRQYPYSNGSSALLPSNGLGGNDSSHAGSEKMKPPSTNNSTIGMVTTNNNNNSIVAPPISSQQSTYDQYSVLSVSQSSQSTPSQHAPFYQHQQPQQQYPPPHTTTVQYPHPYHHQQHPYSQPGYIPVPINQYPA